MEKSSVLYNAFFVQPVHERKRDIVHFSQKTKKYKKVIEILRYIVYNVNI